MPSWSGPTALAGTILTASLGNSQQGQKNLVGIFAQSMLFSILFQQCDARVPSNSAICFFGKRNLQGGVPKHANIQFLALFDDFFLGSALRSFCKGGETGVSITHFAGRTLPLKYSNFQQIYKKKTQPILGSPSKTT